MASPTRRLLFLTVVAAVILAGFAASPAPKVLFRRSPTVADRIPGDVRRVSLAVEDTGGIVGTLHAVLEVWTDSDWDLQYWTSIPGIPDRSGKAKIITNDLIEQRDSHLAIGKRVVALAWVEGGKKDGAYRLKVATKKTSDRDFTKPVAALTSERPIAKPLVIVGRGGMLADRVSVYFTLLGGPQGRNGKVWDAQLGVRDAEGTSARRDNSSSMQTVSYDAFSASLRAGTVEAALPGGKEVLAKSGACCTAIAGFGQRVWVSWLESQNRKGIYRVVRLRYAGPPGRFTGAMTIPVTALSPK